jgi:polyhydroxybutyrate depolymerase
MAQRMALEASSKVAVMATVAGPLPAAFADAQPSHAVSAMLMHGTADQISPIGGGYSRHRGPNGELRGRTLALEEGAERWRTIDRCPPGPGETHATDQSTRTTFEGGVGGTKVAAWTIFGAGHAWPGTVTPEEWGQPSTEEFDAAEEICRFAKPLLTPPDTRRL